eukprot:GHVU01141222.1.p2 GENE.GHVU01141222.1~~GHVU01141222.1.p2  ORF type:complete len:160 (+),score=17.31 GHVU01141222.1:76-555(+)
MIRKKIYYVDYPILSLSGNGTVVVVSGGAGGKNFGIQDGVEVLKLDNDENPSCLVSVVKESKFGVLFGISFDHNNNVFAAGAGKAAIIFSLSSSSAKKEKSPKKSAAVESAKICRLGQWRVLTSDPPETKRGTTIVTYGPTPMISCIYLPSVPIFLRAR